MTEAEKERAAVIAYIELTIKTADECKRSDAAYWMRVLLRDLKNGTHVTGGLG